MALISQHYYWVHPFIQPETVGLWRLSDHPYAGKYLGGRALTAFTKTRYLHLSRFWWRKGNKLSVVRKLRCRVQLAVWRALTDTVLVRPEGGRRDEGRPAFGKLSCARPRGRSPRRIASLMTIISSKKAENRSRFTSIRVLSPIPAPTGDKQTERLE